MAGRITQQAQIDAIAAEQSALRKAVVALEKQVTEEAIVRSKNHEMLTVMFTALMVPQPGQGGKALLERMADVTVQIESGKRTANSVVIFAKWFAAIGAIVGLVTSMRLGLWTKG